jgi:3-deoxy-D-manno-octulosonic-acid transferase
MHAICVQSSESFENFLAYGVYKHQLKLSRNMKFDLLPNEQDDTLGKQIKAHFHLQDRPVLLVASSHDPEEKMLLDVYKRLKPQFEQLVLIVVPRHPHRFDDVHHIIKASGYKTERVSESRLANSLGNTSHSENMSGDNAVKTISKQPVECIVVDAMGWLKACYSICDLTFIGGSFAPKGGHNALEAALYGKPIVMGPSVFNNPSICQHLQEQNALMLVEDPQALYDVLEHWLQHPELAKLDGERGTKVLLRNVGAIEFTMSILRKLL